MNLKPNGLINLKTHFDPIEMIFTRRIFFRLFNFYERTFYLQPQPMAQPHR